MRRSVRDVRAGRQRVLFGVDRLERHVADLTVELLRLLGAQPVTDSVSRETAHVKRLKSWLVLYTELQESDFELPDDLKLEPDTEVSHEAPKE